MSDDAKQKNIILPADLRYHDRLLVYRTNTAGLSSGTILRSLHPDDTNTEPGCGVVDSLARRDATRGRDSRGWSLRSVAFSRSALQNLQRAGPSHVVEREVEDHWGAGGDSIRDLQKMSSVACKGDWAYRP